MNRFQSHRATAALRCGAVCICVLIIAGCGSSKKPASLAPAPTVAAEGEKKPKQKASATACEMVTQAEMSAILGVAVVAKDNTHSTGETDCIYSAPSGFPTVELAVAWGDGEAAMGAFAMVNRSEPGIASPYDGIGDQAAAIGPTLMIRTGEDLVKLIFSGVDDAPAKAKKIFDTAKARM